jgi:hypothetical protein
MRVGDEGRELIADSSGKTATADASAALLRAVQDPELAAVIVAWPSLSLMQRASIAAVVNTKG